MAPREQERLTRDEIVRLADLCEFQAADFDLAKGPQPDKLADKLRRLASPCSACNGKGWGYSPALICRRCEGTGNDPGCPNREPSGVGASASDPTESGPELDHQEPEQGWPEEIVVTRYSGLMTFVSSEEEAREFAARPRVYVDKQKVEGLIGALEEIVALGASWPTGIAREAAQHVEIARAALSEFRGEDGRRG